MSTKEARLEQTTQRPQEKYRRPPRGSPPRPRATTGVADSIQAMARTFNTIHGQSQGSLCLAGLGGRQQTPDVGDIPGSLLAVAVQIAPTIRLDPRSRWSAAGPTGPSRARTVRYRRRPVSLSSTRDRRTTQALRRKGRQASTAIGFKQASGPRGLALEQLGGLESRQGARWNCCREIAAAMPEDRCGWPWHINYVQPSRIGKG